MTFWEWIGFKQRLDYTSVPLLGSFIGFATTLIAIAVVGGGIATICQFLSEVFSTGPNHEAIRNIGLIVVATLGAPFVVWRATIAQKQANTAEQTYITDQINTAVFGLGTEKTTSKIGRRVKVLTGDFDELTVPVDNSNAFRLPPKSVELRRYSNISRREDGSLFEGLHIDIRTWEIERGEIEWQDQQLVVLQNEAISHVGDWSDFSVSLPNIEVRLGAIYALERIAHESVRDHFQIMEILTAYIRENAPVQHLEPTKSPFKRARPRWDVQAALDVIGRRKHDSIMQEHSRRYRLDLREVDLSGANFSNGQFEGALMSGSRFEGSNFRSTNLKGARLQRCLLDFAEFWDANLLGANIDDATITSSSIGSITSAADMRGLSMAGANLSKLSALPKRETHFPTFGTSDTKLARNLTRTFESLTEELEAFALSLGESETKDDDSVRERLTKAGFLYWSPYGSADLANHEIRNRLLDHIGLTGFPYRDA